MNYSCEHVPSKPFDNDEVHMPPDIDEVFQELQLPKNRTYRPRKLFKAKESKLEGMN